MMETELLRKILKTKEMYNVDWIGKTNQRANSLTKFGSSSEKILNFKRNKFSINKNNI